MRYQAPNTYTFIVPSIEALDRSRLFFAVTSQIKSSKALLFYGVA